MEKILLFEHVFILGIQFRLADQKVDSSDEKSCFLLSRDRFLFSRFQHENEFGFKALLIPSLRETLSILNVLFNKRCVSARGGRGGAESAG